MQTICTIALHEFVIVIYATRRIAGTGNFGNSPTAPKANIMFSELLFCFFLHKNIIPDFVILLSIQSHGK